jgi:hypothetical protein
MSNKHGEIDWTDPSVGSSDNKGGKDEFLRLAPGSNVIRILTLPHQYYQHRYMDSSGAGKKYGYRINCSGSNGSCDVCARGDKPKRRWLLGVIDRKTNSYKILDIGYSIFKELKDYASSESWGDPSKYDIDIKVDPAGGPTSYYHCIPSPPKPLTATDLVLRDEHGVEALVRRSTAPEPNFVSEKFANILKEIEGSSSMAATGTDDNPDFSFKNYDDQVSKEGRKAPF